MLFAVYLAYKFNMAFVPQLLRYIGLVAFTFMILGFYKPWAMLWWEDVQNRRKVIRLYGSITLVSFILSQLLSFIL
jgi:hypothetical protein